MSDMPGYFPPWMLMESLIEWVKLLAATHIGYRFVRAYASRPHDESTHRALQRRVHELEQVTESLGSGMQQVLEAERFATTLMLRRGAGQARDAEPVRGEADPAARGD